MVDELRLAEPAVQDRGRGVVLAPVVRDLDELESRGTELASVEPVESPDDSGLAGVTGEHAPIVVSELHGEDSA